MPLFVLLLLCESHGLVCGMGTGGVMGQYPRLRRLGYGPKRKAAVLECVGNVGIVSLCRVSDIGTHNFDTK